MGLKIWLWQRFTAVYLLGYGLWIGLLLAQLPSYDYAHWKALWAGPSVTALSLVAFGAMGVHALLGLWFVTSDYLKPPLLRWGLLGVYFTWLALLLAHFVQGGLA